MGRTIFKEKMLQSKNKILLLGYNNQSSFQINNFVNLTYRRLKYKGIDSKKLAISNHPETTQIIYSL